MIGDHPVNLVTSRELVHILQTVQYFADRNFDIWSVKWSTFEICIDMKFFAKMFAVDIDNDGKFLEVTKPS